MAEGRGCQPASSCNASVVNCALDVIEKRSRNRIAEIASSPAEIGWEIRAGL